MNASSCPLLPPQHRYHPHPHPRPHPRFRLGLRGAPAALAMCRKVSETSDTKITFDTRPGFSDCNCKA